VSDVDGPLLVVPLGAVSAETEVGPVTRTLSWAPLTSWKADRTLTLLRAITAGLAFGNHHAWLAYTIAVRRLARKKHLPRKLMAFLDDAHRLDLLRTVGPIYQFRHAEPQDHLAALPPPNSTAMSPSSEDAN
ncbi:hypothetical protein, partial [Streptosporangium sp. NPDC048865]|uniref:hypothetical protein n=1 Tax=Streptosporangium sp. NPDC048865 TaxID=3155766 RepID=UPI00343E7148